VDAIVFVGGDGTARDVWTSVGDRVPLLGVPSGVKMHSGVFALSPEAAAAIVGEFAEGRGGVSEGEIVDLDEEAVRRGQISPHIFAVARALTSAGLLQASKAEYAGEDESVSKLGVSDAFLERMDEVTLYIIGPGTTTGAIMEAMGLKHTMLGVDLVRGHAVVKSDATAMEILEELRASGAPAEIVVSAIGRQGFVFGRGNLQLTPEVIRMVGPKRITIVATERKAAELSELLADTGDPALDSELAGHWRVLCGYRFHVLLPLRAASSSE
jgi:predicted polyphosphate/ATP-dependent NAD kinase